MAAVEFVNDIYEENPVLNAFVPKIYDANNQTVIGNALFLRQALVLWDLFLKSEEKENFVKQLNDNDLILMGFTLGLNISYYEGYQTKLNTEVHPFSHKIHVLENLKELLQLELADNIYVVIIGLLIKSYSNNVNDLKFAFDHIVTKYVAKNTTNTDNFIIELNLLLLLVNSI